MIAVYTIQHTRNDLSAAFYLMAAAAVSFFVIVGPRETSKVSS
jgi:hypothetical protein